MDKIDFRKSLKTLFAAPRDRFVEVEVPRLLFVKIDGHGDPSTDPSYPAALAWLYSTVYAIKFAAKVEGRDFAVPPLEGLWSAKDPASFTARRKHEWDWTMMIMVPDFVDAPRFEAAAEKAAGKLGNRPPDLRLEPLREGLSLQALHIGSYDEEGPLLARLHKEIMPEKGYTFAGPHHEIYLSDPRRTPAAKLKTILRQPVRPI